MVRTRATTTRDRNLQFRGAVSTGGSPLDFFAFSPVFMCNLVRRAPKNLEKVAKNPVEKIASNPVTSVAVMIFSALTWKLLGKLPGKRMVRGLCENCRCLRGLVFLNSTIDLAVSAAVHAALPPTPPSFPCSFPGSLHSNFGEWGPVAGRGNGKAVLVIQDVR